MEHTCTRSCKNPRCSANFLAKKLMKKVRRQLDIKLKDIQEVMHEKYVVNISAGKASRAREKAQEQYNQSIMGLMCRTKCWVTHVSEVPH